MNILQVNNIRLQAYLRSKHHVQGLRPLPPVSVSFANRYSSIPAPVTPKTSRQKHRQCMPVCLSRGDTISGNDGQEPIWKSIGKAFENFGRKPSVVDVLKQQIEKREYYDEGGSGKDPPGGGSDGGGGSGGGGFGGSEDEGFSGILDETIQVILATIGFIFLYIYIINGAEMTRLAKDYIKFLFGGKKSVRLTRALYQWERFKKLTEKKEVDRFWLEKAIINTPTWWDNPEKYRRILRAYVQAQSRSYDDS